MAASNIYLQADMTIKVQAIAKITPQDAVTGRYLPPDPSSRSSPVSDRSRDGCQAVALNVPRA